MKKHIVLYDDECPMCTFQMRLLTWLDWRNALALVPLSDPRAQEMAPSLRREDLLAAIHCVTAGGAIHRGARCLRFAGMRLPLLLPLALVLWIPGVIQVAEWIYKWVSRNRMILSRIFGCKEACALMPKRIRAQDELTR
jgi:predicted DCC family thiol-disulfide oxidoreductase YuxK